ncbi:MULTISPECIES: LysR family transcriptional regulator [Celeribacter]|jgi:DNA-binding transcriptional LysR family regulator|uniref:LysR family transcriptional regulator n=1 Tax=Celeribacter halophilus TaxID=576117 RepID=A0AAW7XRA8_9RHOB|nr:LysR family transcriptional regulator [Celeribacter halophilus]MBU2889181.1 LysR family transcriptional regulator [Celeribacter halophilus]MDO6456226.1 LysR family transcriptional regulator [Celeribacter halophilus]MDO6510292.1 LysR family transcriptional regulator [Celeribacter halophilus]MDO6722717.1 LysR family transcriptional regulator [Celeribacter halophilus]
MSDKVGRLTLWGVEVFLAVAEDGSVSAAAKRLGASPSAVSQQISNLETALGTELINRRERPMSLTPAGRVLRRRAQSILLEAARARSEIAGLDLSHLGQLRLGMVEDFEASVTPLLITQMADRLTETRFELETGPSHRLVDQLENRALDVIVAAELSEGAEWCDHHPLLQDPFVAVVPKGQRDAPKRLPLIQYTRRHAMGRTLAEHLISEGVTLTHRFELDSYRAIQAMVAGGTGWTILSSLGVLNAGRYAADIEAIPLPIAPLSRKISLTVRRDGMSEMASELAGHLGPLLQDQVVDPLVATYPWLGGYLKLL